MTLGAMTRRDVLVAGAAAGFTAAAAPRFAFAAGGVTLGAKTIDVVSDGHLTLPLSFSFPDVPEAEVKALLAAHGMPTDQSTPDCNLTLLRDGDRIVLFDAGSGPNFMPTAGKIADSLAAIGIDPAVVTDVVFTHAHPDHVWGVLDGFDDVVFPEAAFHMSRVEWDFWRAPETLDTTPEERKTFVIGARNRFEKMEERITLFDAGAEVLPGVEAFDTRGHTPGHTSFVVHDGSSSVMIVGDAMTNVAISFERPDWPTGSDQDPQKGAATRKMLLDRLAQDKTQIVGFHLPHPGLGTVERKGTAYRFAAS